MPSPDLQIVTVSCNAGDRVLGGFRSPDRTGRVREFAFDDQDFEAISTQVKALTGINLTRQKRELVYGRLAVRLRAWI